MKDKKVTFITQAALIAAIYVVLTYIFAPFSFGEIQVRISEALTILPVFTPAAIPGLFVGCLLGNMLGGALLPDIIFGSLATLIGAFFTWKLRNAHPFFAPVPPIAANTVIVPFVLRYAYGILLPVLREYHAKYPDVHLRIQNQKTHSAVEAVRNRLADLAVVTTPTQISKPLAETKLLDFHEVLVCGANCGDLPDKPRHLSEIKDYPMVSLGRDSMTFQFYNDFFFRYGLEYTVDVEAATADQLLPLITNDLGIGFVPESLIEGRNLTDQVFRIPLIEEVPVRSICLIEYSGSALDSAAARLKEMLVQAAGK